MMTTMSAFKSLLDYYIIIYFYDLDRNEWEIYWNEI